MTSGILILRERIGFIAKTEAKETSCAFCSQRSFRGMASSRTGRTSFDDLGCELVRRIFSSCSPIQLANCSLVCSSWHDIITSSPGLWRSAYFLDHGGPNPHRVRTASSTHTLEKKENDEEEEKEEKEVADVDFRTLYIDMERRARLANGHVSTFSWMAHFGRVNCCRMVMGQVVSGSSDGTIKVWGGGPSITYKVPGKARVVQVEFDESKVIGAAGKDVFLWSRIGNRRLLKRMGGQSEVCSLCVADSDLAMGCGDGTVRVFDLYSGRCTQIFRMHEEPVKGVVMDMATQSMASGSSDGTVQLFDARSGQKIVSLLGTPPAMTGISCLHSSPLDQKLFAGSVGGNLYCFDLRNQQTLWDFRVGGSALTCMDNPAYSCSTIGVGGIDGTIKVFGADSAKLIATLQIKNPRLPSSPVLGLAFGMTKLISCHADWNLVQWQLGESTSRLEEDQYGRHVLKRFRSP